MATNAYLNWACDKEHKKEHVSFSNFVKTFDIIDMESANRAHLSLNSSHRIRENRRKRLYEAYKEFRERNEVIFLGTACFEIDIDVETAQLLHRAAAVQVALTEMKHIGTLPEKCEDEIIQIGYQASAYLQNTLKSTTPLMADVVESLVERFVEGCNEMGLLESDRERTRADGKVKSLAVTTEDGDQAEFKRKEGNSGSLA
ncbi:hypothetical protein BG011_009657 [Mortierella polycephala]|uniref:Uncharacterized protein n=1 Tax=Mortierella polycephala TaxID=41804 RepID=A0A9P6Q8A0_9FUNG|nr:hypothetical protein BG011_009657 [Mortierella polycephala]